MRKETARKTGVPEASVDWLRVLGNFPEFISTLSSKNVRMELKEVFFAISEAFHIENLALHTEASFAVAAGFHIAAAYKAALDLRAKVGITYDEHFVQEGSWIYDASESSMIQELKSYINSPEFRKLTMQYSKFIKS